MQIKQRSAGMIVVRLDEDACRFLLLRAYRYWDFPKGLVEPGEFALEAALREAAEEAGVEDLAMRWGEAYYETAPYGPGKVARYYLAATSQHQVVLPVSSELGRPEHHEARWVTYQEGRRLLNDRVGAALDWANRRTGCHARSSESP